MEQQLVLQTSEVKEIQSCFLPGTQIQFAKMKHHPLLDKFEEVALFLLERAKYSDGCFLCHLAPTGNGYPYFQLGGRAGNKMKVSRIMYMAIAKRFIPSDIFVCHECDNPQCINPVHLFEGTAQDNVDDMIAKGRKVDDPEVGHRRKLATAKLIAIRLNEGKNRHDIRNELGLSFSTIWNYTNGPYRDYLLLFTRNTAAVRVR